MTEKYNRSDPAVAREWLEWAELCPQSDNAQDYVTQTGGLFVPMRDALFSGTGVSQYEVLSRERGQRVGSFGPRAVGLRKVRSTSCVLHSGNHSSNARKTHSRIIVEEADGTVVDVPIGCLNSVYPGRDEQRQARKEKLSVEKKAARDKKARLDARRREEGWDCGDIIVNASEVSIWYVVVL